MDDPFLESTLKTGPERKKKSFLAKECQHYNLGALAIVFGLGTVLLGLATAIVACAISATIWTSPLMVYFAVGAWSAGTLWLWVSLVLIGKTGKKSRVSDGDLIALQFIFFINVLGHALFASPQDRVIWHEASLGFEWCVIAFHILYFLLALCVWVRLPPRSYIAFLVMLALAIVQSIL